jgi:hypothetical protein
LRDFLNNTFTGAGYRPAPVFFCTCENIEFDGYLALPSAYPKVLGFLENETFGWPTDLRIQCVFESEAS